jgi:integrase
MIGKRGAVHMAEKKRKWTRSFGVYKRKDRGREGGVWWIRYTHDGKQVRESTGKLSKREALQCLHERLGQVADGRFSLSLVKESPRFSEYADEFLATHSKNTKTPQGCRRDETSVKNLKDFFGEKRLNSITPMLIEHYRRARLDKGRSHATVNRETACLKTIFSMAVKSRRAVTNPVKGMKLLREDNVVQNVLSQEDEEKLLANAAEHIRRVVICALETGLRLGEILSLRWESVDLVTGFIRVERSKSGKKREIPISDRLRSVLSEAGKKGRDGEVFRHMNGKPIKSVREGYANALEGAKLTEKGYRFHDLRHTFATRLVLSGTDLATVQTLLGHSTPMMTMRYAHPGLDDKRRAIDRLASWQDNQAQANDKTRNY